MATYKQIQDFVFALRGYTPHPGWIAHVKEDHRLTSRRAKSRKDDADRRHPCPKSKREDIVTAFKHFGML